jgi:tetratricopeptide (TPR) repeat protein
MGNVIRFAEARSRNGFERVKSTYTVREISRQFGLSERHVRHWVQDGMVRPAPASSPNEPIFDLDALEFFRSVRELRNQGMTFKRIELQLHGQLSLFPEQGGKLIELPRRITSFEEALLLHERGDRRAAEKYLEAALEGDHTPDAYCNLGIMEFEAGKVASAFDRFTKALMADPRHFESHFNLAHLYFESGEMRLAQLHYEIAAEIEPSFADLYYNLGLVHAMNGSWKQAATALNQAKELVSEDEGKKVETLLSRVEKALQNPPPPPPE